MPTQRIDSVSLFLDGSVSLFGLTCAVDDLQITYLVSKDDFFNPASWEIDLAGLAVSADMSGRHDRRRPAQVDVADGRHRVPRDAARPLRRLRHHDLRRLRRGHRRQRRPASSPSSPSAPSSGRSAARRRSSSPASAAASASTGRSSSPPTCRRFGEYPLIQALDIAASPGNPMEQLRALGAVLPDGAGHVLVRRRRVVHQLRASSRASPSSPSRSATGSTSACSASPASPSPAPRSPSSRSSSPWWCASRRRRACCGCRASSPTTRGCSTATCGSPAGSPTSSGSRDPTPASSC